MNIRHIRLFLAALAGLFLVTFALAQDAAAAAAPAASGITADNIVTWLTPIVVPLLIGLVKHFAPSIPSFVLPILAPVLGVLLDLVNTYGLHHQGNLALAAVAGLAGVGIREVKDQLTPKADPPVGG